MGNDFEKDRSQEQTTQSGHTGQQPSHSGQQPGQQQKNPQDPSRKNPSGELDEQNEQKQHREQGGQRRAS